MLHQGNVGEATECRPDVTAAALVQWHEIHCDAVVHGCGSSTEVNMKHLDIAK